MSKDQVEELRAQRDELQAKMRVEIDSYVRRMLRDLQHEIDEITKKIVELTK